RRPRRGRACASWRHPLGSVPLILLFLLLRAGLPPPNDLVLWIRSGRPPFPIGMDAMAFCYIVRCRFTEPAREQAWNAWYSGPKREQMLAQPVSLTCQRFRLAAGRGRGYLTLWTVDSPQALATPQYTAQWGFAEWAPYVADWSRDLFDGNGASEQAFAV